MVNKGNVKSEITNYHLDIVLCRMQIQSFLSRHSIVFNLGPFFTRRARHYDSPN